MIMTTTRPKQQGKTSKNSAFPSSASSKKKRQRVENKALTACVVECGHDPAKDYHEHCVNHESQQTMATTNVTSNLVPTAAQKELSKVLEAGLMINGLKVLFTALAEKIELHVNHNVITPELLQELEDVAQATLLTTKKLKVLRAPCCDLYTIPAVSEEDVD